MTAQPRSKYYKARILSIEYTDLEVLATDEQEAREALSHLTMVMDSDYVSQTDTLVLLGLDEIGQPEMPEWEKLTEYYPGGLEVKAGDVIIPEVLEVMDRRTWEYHKVYPQRS